MLIIINSSAVQLICLSSRGLVYYRSTAQNLIYRWCFFPFFSPLVSCARALNVWIQWKHVKRNNKCIHTHTHTHIFLYAVAGCCRLRRTSAALLMWFYGSSSLQLHTSTSSLPLLCCCICFPLTPHPQTHHLFIISHSHSCLGVLFFSPPIPLSRLIQFSTLSSLP